MTKHQCDGEKYIRKCICYTSNGTKYVSYMFFCDKCKLSYANCMICLECHVEFTNSTEFVTHANFLHPSSTLNH